eukprot:scaffold3954_cov19-Tisochrysis_lutea.AAC.2
MTRFIYRRVCSHVRNGSGYIAVPACEGILAEAEKVPVNKPNHINPEMYAGQEESLCSVLDLCLYCSHVFRNSKVGPSGCSNKEALVQKDLAVTDGQMPL